MKYEFMALEQRSLIVAPMRVPTLSYYDMQLVSIEEERIRLFVKGLNHEL